MDQQKQQQNHFPIYLPKPTLQLGKIFSQLKLFSKQRLDTNDQNPQGLQNESEIKGLKFISTKLAKLFFKNRKLPYNQISKILIDNFASQKKDERNIKRRVYDAINVLVAAGILIKKNNSIEMIKNKIKPRIQIDRKDKMEEQIAQKQATIEQKMRHYQQLIHKHKLIKNLFERNRKITHEIQNHHNSNLKDSIHKSILRKRSRNEFEINSEDRNESQISNKTAQIIHEPHIFIITEINCLQTNRNENKMIKNFSNHNQIQIFIPNETHTLNLQQNFLQKVHRILKIENYFLPNDQNQMQEDFVKEQKIETQKDHSKQHPKSSKNVYSLIDILSFLNLDQLKKV